MGGIIAPELQTHIVIARPARVRSGSVRTAIQFGNQRKIGSPGSRARSARPGDDDLLLDLMRVLANCCKVYQRFFQACSHMSQFGQGLTVFSYTTPSTIFGVESGAGGTIFQGFLSPERAVPDAARSRATTALGC
jgi:hypothetical protein